MRHLTSPYNLIYLVLWWIITVSFLAFLAALILRLIFNYSDPNPFGKIGRFSYYLKKKTDRFVYPSARFLANFRVDTRLAPILTFLIAGVLSYFALSIFYETFWVIQQLSEAKITGNVKAFIGFALYGLLDVLILFIFIRFIASWFVFSSNAFLNFVYRVTEPVLSPFRKIIPTIGMFDISAMIVLILISFLQTIVLSIFVRS